MFSSRTRLVHLRLNHSRREARKERLAKTQQQYDKHLATIDEVQKVSVIKNEFNQALREFLGECKREPLSNRDAQLIDIAFLNCAISHATAVTPVKLVSHDKLYDLRSLYKLENFHSEDGFLVPTSTKRFTKKDILAAPAERKQIMEYVSERKKQASIETPSHRFLATFFWSNKVSKATENFLMRRKKILFLLNGFLSVEEAQACSIRTIMQAVFPTASNAGAEKLEKTICDKLKLPRSFLFSHTLSALSPLQFKQLSSIAAEGEWGATPSSSQPEEKSTPKLRS